jgi:hypothetical protein
MGCVGQSSVGSRLGIFGGGSGQIFPSITKFLSNFTWIRNASGIDYWLASLILSLCRLPSGATLAMSAPSRDLAADSTQHRLESHWFLRRLAGSLHAALAGDEGNDVHGGLAALFENLRSQPTLCSSFHAAAPLEAVQLHHAVPFRIVTARCECSNPRQRLRGGRQSREGSSLSSSDAELLMVDDDSPPSGFAMKTHNKNTTTHTDNSSLGTPRLTSRHRP